MPIILLVSESEHKKKTPGPVKRPGEGEGATIVRRWGGGHQLLSDKEKNIFSSKIFVQTFSFDWS